MVLGVHESSEWKTLTIHGACSTSLLVFIGTEVVRDDAGWQRWRLGQVGQTILVLVARQPPVAFLAPFRDFEMSKGYA